ncbi:MAG: DUF222 domain-containing protein [Kineosporiaceae bacterium]
MSVMEACFAESGDPDEVAALRAECARLRARDGELRTAGGRLERRVNRLVEEQDWATRRIARLTDRCTQLAGLVPVADEETTADGARAVDGEALAGEAAVGGLVAALTGEGGARLAAAIQTAVGDLAALSVPDPATGVELGCLADLPDRTVADLAAAGCRLATWAKLATTVATEELVTRWENGNADEHASPVNAQPVFPDHDLGFRAAIAETATTCVISESTLTARVDTLRELPARLPGLWHLLATGAVDIDTARLVHSKTRHLPGEVLSRLESQILVKVTKLTWGQLAAWLDRIVAKADPRDLAEQIADNLERRNVSFRTAGPGTGRMTLTASVEAIEAIRMALLGYASAGDDPGHHRPAAAIRADIITDLITRPGTCTRTAPASSAGSGTGAGTDTGTAPASAADTDTRTGADTGTDAGTGTAPASAAALGTDTRTEAGTGTGTGAGTAPGTGAGSGGSRIEPDTHSRTDAQPDADADAGADREREGGTGPDIDLPADPDDAAEPSNGTRADQETTTDRDTADENEPDTQGDGDPRVVAEPPPEAGAETYETDTPTDGQDATPTNRPCTSSPPLGSETLAALPGPRVHVTVPLSAVLGGEGIGEINDYGPLTAETIRDLLAGLHRMGVTATAVPDHRRQPGITHPRHRVGHQQGTPRPGPHRHRTAPRGGSSPGAVLRSPAVGVGP